MLPSDSGSDLTICSPGISTVGPLAGLAAISAGEGTAQGGAVRGSVKCSRHLPRRRVSSQPALSARGGVNYDNNLEPKGQFNKLIKRLERKVGRFLSLTAISRASR